jgi:aminoglycoside 2''-phosphotransferase
MDAQACRETLERCLPDLCIRTVRPITTGWDSYVLEVNGELIFRFPRRPEIEAGLEKEVRLLPELAPALPLPVPRFEFVGHRREGCPRPFVGYRKLPGVALDPEVLKPGRVPHIARQLGSFLSALQRFPRQEAARLGVPDATPAEWRRQYRELYERMREQVFPLLGPRVQTNVAAFWEGHLACDEHFHFEPVLLHRDLTAEHILYDPERGTLTGIIDWGDASIGDPAFDFTGPFFDYGRDFVEQMLAAYRGNAVGGTFWKRISFYARIIPFYEAAYGLLERDESHIRAGVGALEAGFA